MFVKTHYPSDDQKLQSAVLLKQPTKFDIYNVYLNLLNTKHSNRWKSNLIMKLETLI